MLFIAHQRLTHRVRLVAAFVLAAGMVLSHAGSAYAASITVTTTVDELNTDGDCSLREAVRAANRNVRVDACPAGSIASGNRFSRHWRKTCQVIC
jgi:CSLREA domain-containing protein